MENCKTKVLRQTSNGKLVFCVGCNQFHIEYKNLKFNFTQKEYSTFTNYVQTIDGHYWTLVNKDSVYFRKIIVPMGHKNMSMLFHLEEIEELKELCVFTSKNQSANSYLKSAQLEPLRYWN